MDPLEYLGSALPSWRDYVLLLVISAVLHWFLLLRRRTFGIFDPLFFVLLGSIFGWAIVWFMYLRGDISTQYVVSFTLTELAFYAGLYVAAGRMRRMPPRRPSDEQPDVAVAVLVAASLVHVASTLATWALAGIPLFRVSRLGAFVDSGGFGLFERLSDAGGPIALFTALYLLIGNSRRRGRVTSYAFLAWYVVSVALSGSKSALLVIGQCAFAVAFLHTTLTLQPDRFWGGRLGKGLIAVSALFAVAVLVIQNSSDFASGLVALAYRMVNYGDIYIVAYPRGTIEQLRGDNPFIGLFAGFLSTFRLYPQDGLYTNIGYQFMLLAFPDLDYFAGPNPRHSVFGYHYFGAFAFIYSFVLGIVTSYLQKNLYLGRAKSFLHMLMAFVLYSTLVGISVDFEYSMTRFASSIITLCVVLPPALLLFPRRRKTHKRLSRHVNPSAGSVATQ